MRKGKDGATEGVARQAFAGVGKADGKVWNGQDKKTEG